ncbi:hypothetical protein JIN84_05755 [Luteolibacter yonseiensis]|uniref:Uncharacterized protein n=1 Tax=Luteolibacter yonseiensis TaxID=1144680 RepID=A0A934VAQ2_9BACT|nr:hypothetical protein [Luteolibacter yonseiensis]MBK1815106.1 hypothetical protein [Luteolibacter yonseiensis]
MKRFYMLNNEMEDPSAGGGGGEVAATGLTTGPTTGLATGLLGESQAAVVAKAAAAPGRQAGGGFDFRKLVGDDGRFTPDWVTKLPEDLQQHRSHFAKYSDPLQALQHTLNLQQILGKKAEAVVIPAADAPREEWAPVLKRLGVPDSPEGYGLRIPEELPQGVTVDEEELNEFARYAHDIGLTPQQVAKLQEYDLGRAGKWAATGEEQARAWEVREFNRQSEILTKAWGNGPEAVQKKALAERAALTFGFTPEEVGNDPLFRNARFVMTLARAGAAMSEDALVKGSDINSVGGLRARAQDVISNPANPLYKRYWDGDPDANAQVHAWMKAG